MDDFHCAREVGQGIKQIVKKTIEQTAEKHHIVDVIYPMPHLHLHMSHTVTISCMMNRI